MYTVDTDRIIQLVCLYAHLPLQNSLHAVALAESAAAYIGGILLREPQTSQEITACEHAAACVALCDLAKIEASGFEPVLTAGGSFTKDGKSGLTLQSAETLKKDAFIRLGELIDSEDFYFEGVDG